MPIYEFFCHECNMIFNFFSKRIDTTTRPLCPKCLKVSLDRKVSPFAVTGRAKENDDLGDLPFDESKMEQAMNLLAGEADKINEDDPRQAAQLMRKLTDMTGIGLGPGMEEALRRMERGEDPEAIEAEMGDIMEQEEPFILPEKKAGKSQVKSPRPQTDPVLYDLHPET